MKKRYAAVLLGEPATPRGVIDAPIPVAVNGVSTLREARTIYAVERVVPSLKAESLTLVHFAPRTGRTHQLRRHAADVLRCPIVGDALYDGGGAAAMQFRRRGLFLCARYLELDHPCVPGERLRVEIPLPAKFDDLLARESDRFERLAAQQNDIDEDLLEIMHKMYVNGDTAKKKELEAARQAQVL